MFSWPPCAASRVPQEPRRKTQLMHGLIELRAKHEKKLRKMLTKNVIRELRKRLKRAAKEVRPETSRDALNVARAMLNRSRTPGWSPSRRRSASVPDSVEASPVCG